MGGVIKLLAAAVAAAGLLTGCGTALGSGPTERIAIDIRYSAFEPQKITVERGSIVVFEITNTDPIDHEFILGDEGVQEIHEKGTEAHHGAKPGEVSVPAGESRTTSYEFTEAGTLIFGCHLPGHYAYGMRGAVEVR
jgi:uncharacterized cupredoxin-like copper-binding protein